MVSGDEIALLVSGLKQDKWISDGRVGKLKLFRVESGLASFVWKLWKNLGELEGAPDWMVFLSIMIIVDFVLDELSLVMYCRRRAVPNMYNQS